MNLQVNNDTVDIKESKPSIGNPPPKEYKIEFDKNQDMSVMKIGDDIEIELNNGNSIKGKAIEIYKNIVTVKDNYMKIKE